METKSKHQQILICCTPIISYFSQQKHHSQRCFNLHTLCVIQRKKKLMRGGFLFCLMCFCRVYLSFLMSEFKSGFLSSWSIKYTLTATKNGFETKNILLLYFLYVLIKKRFSYIKASIENTWFHQFQDWKLYCWDQQN